MNVLKQILPLVNSYVKDILINELDSHYTFHNWEHTKEVTEEAEKIAYFHDLNEEKVIILKIASYFHDTGYSLAFREHEKNSCQIAMEFLKKSNVPQSAIDEVIEIIKSTKLNAKCTNLLQKIIHDADLCHIGKTVFRQKGKALRKEWKYFLGKDFTEKEWVQLQIDFLSKTFFFTEPAQDMYDYQRRKNIESLKLELLSYKDND